MSQPSEATSRELSLTRVINASPDKLYKAWTTPELMKQWFAPAPYSVPEVVLDLRPGGANLIVMRGPEGPDFPNRGVYLDLVENEKIVFTDAFTSAWVPSEKPFMTATITFEDIGNGQTRYTAHVLHWSVEDREMHEKMGFHEGWGKCADQLAALVEAM